MHRKRLTKLFLIGTVLLLLISGCGPDPDILLETGSLEQEKTDSEKSAAGRSQEQKKTEQKFLYVYICGKIKNPGVYCMKEGDRIFRLIEMAGGLTREADAYAVNQAELLTDGSMIYIPSKEESENGYAASSQNRQDSESGKVNINTASEDELMTLSGIGEGKAKSIISYREEQGKFQSIEDVMNVDGIKEGVFSQIKDRITV